MIQPLPTSFQDVDLLRFIAELQKTDWKLLQVLSKFKGQGLLVGDLLALVALFAVLTGQESAFDVYGEDGAIGTLVPTLYHRVYTPYGSSSVDSKLSLQPEVRSYVLSFAHANIPSGTVEAKDADMLRYLLAGGLYSAASRVMDVFYEA